MELVFLVDIEDAILFKFISLTDIILAYLLLLLGLKESKFPKVLSELNKIYY